MNIFKKLKYKFTKLLGGILNNKCANQVINKGDYYLGVKYGISLVKDYINNSNFYNLEEYKPFIKELDYYLQKESKDINKIIINHNNGWINVKDALPPIDNKRNDYMSVKVLTLSDTDDLNIDYYDYSNKEWYIQSEYLKVFDSMIIGEQTIYWTYLPDLP